MKKTNVIAEIEKTGCKIEKLGERMIRVIRNGRSSGVIFDNNNIVRFCGTEYFECTGHEIFEALK